MTETKRRSVAKSFRQALDEEFATAEERQSFVSDVETTIAIARLMSTLEEIREKRNVSKAEIARQMQRHAPAIARLFSGDRANPTIRTLVELLQAMGLRATLVIEPAAAVSRRRTPAAHPALGSVFNVRARIPAAATV